jgi:hypothetical protein
LRSRTNIMKVFKIFFASCFLIIHTIYGQQNSIAFPNAEGFGKFTSGGRGGKILYVTNLEDSGAGSFRKAVETSGARTILFAVSGTITLARPLTIRYGDVTIAGQSAPGDGICIKGQPVGIDADNVIVRFIRFRLGDEAGVEADAFGSNRECNNVIIDHCSISWGTDEAASFYRNRGVTMQWCIISEGLNESVHEKGEHGYGGIWGGEGASFHHNLIAHHASRLPRFSGSASTPNSEDELVDFSNNVIYNWGTNNTYGGERGKYNIVNNYYKAGPASSKRVTWFLDPSEPYGKFYVGGNIVFNNPVVNEDNWKGVKGKSQDSMRVDNPYEVVAINLHNAQEAYDVVLMKSGASLSRDVVDARIVEEVKNGTATYGKEGKGLIDSQKDVGGWPMLKSDKALKDSDGDGMPDVWERKHGLNPKDSEDGIANTLDSYFTNVEVYLNSLVKHTF